MDKYYIVDGENMFLNFHGQIIEFDTADSAFDFLKSLPDYEKIYYGEVHCGKLLDEKKIINLTGKTFADLRIKSQD